MATVTFDATVSAQGAPEVEEVAPAAPTPAVESEEEILRGAAERLRESSTALAVQGSNTGLIGDWDNDDLRIPELRLTGKTGKLSDVFTPGSFVLDKEAQITDGTKTSLTVVALRMRKQYRENLSFDSEEFPRVFDTKEEVRSNGGRITRDTGKGCYSPIAHIELLIEEPDDFKLPEAAESCFYLSHGGKRYARASYTVSSHSAYSEVAMTLATALSTKLAKTGLVGGKWTLQSELAKNAKNSWIAPVLRSAGYTDPAFQEWAASL